jgi:hypothetical protein
MSAPVVATTLHHAFKVPQARLKLDAVHFALDWMSEHHVCARAATERICPR